ncbi:MAG TPA: heme ABC exporter ATP-binding protein CcmA [Sphingomonas sp.]|nr:heme ABC exporter ATP-binding protein CcmA [Sphingomonas sp.]
MTLRFETVACARSGRVLFSSLSFVLGPGDAASVTGPNGVGKSSLIRIAAGLLAPFAGTVTCDADRALLTEASALDGDRTLVSALRFWASLDPVRDADPDSRVGGAVTLLDLAGLADIPVRLLSTGQRRRAAFARVVASAAPVWLLDEPANGLDAVSVARLEFAIAGHRARGGTVVVATHLPLAMPGAQEIRLAVPVIDEIQA